MTNNDELERARFNKWYAGVFDIDIAAMPEDSMARIIYSSLWQGWLARSKQEEA